MLFVVFPYFTVRKIFQYELFRLAVWQTAKNKIKNQKNY